jgi:hypothetical protein
MGLFTGMGEKITVGQSVLSPTLKLTQSGPNVLCVGIEDLNGNKAQVTQRVIFDDGTLPTNAPVLTRKKVVPSKKP